jgi:predicted ATP-grasp superfamily ATP-dependent carboligase
MGGSGSEGALKILVHESVTGGFLVDRDLPPSWVAEGAAMLLAISEDFAAVPGVRVLATIDARLPIGTPPGVVFHLVYDPASQSIAGLAARSDYTALIAPETDGLLAETTRSIIRAGGRPLGSEPDAVELVADKARLAAHFEARGIPTPASRVLDPSRGLPADWDGPLVIKPVDGAGSLETFVVVDRRIPAALEPGRKMLVQPLCPGRPMSASFLVDREGRAWLIAVGLQRVEPDGEGRISYQGGTVPARTSVDVAGVARAVDTVPGLRGFVGVDFLDDGRGSAVILEINPRPTTSYVGLARLAPAGTIAGAWLAAISTGLVGTDWPDRLRSLREHPPVAFGADGSIRTEEIRP